MPPPPPPPIIAAISGGSWNCLSTESGRTTTVRVFLSCALSMTISFFAASTDLTVPTSVRNVPVTTSSGVKRAPSSLLSPFARNWSPTFISPIAAGFLSANLIESGA